MSIILMNVLIGVLAESYNRGDLAAWVSCHDNVNLIGSRLVFLVELRLGAPRKAFFAREGTVSAEPLHNVFRIQKILPVLCQSCSGGSRGFCR